MLSVPRVVLILSPSAGYERGLLRGIARYARQHGPWVFYLAGDESALPLPTNDSMTATPVRLGRRGPRRPGPSPLDLRALGATGVIGRLYNPALAKKILASRLPVIAMDLTDEQLAQKGPLAQISEIRPDSHKAGHMAAEHLLERGLRHFAFCGYPGENWSRWRAEGFCGRLQESGFTARLYQPRQNVRVPWHRELPAVAAWLESLPKPVGVMACNDVRGRQAIEACVLGKLHVPNDVAVVGVDEDRLLSEFSNPPLSSVALNAEQGGYEAARLLDELMSGRARRRQQILVEPLWVVARPSTDVIAVENRDVAAALVYVRDHARRPIGVQDVVRHSAMSRRTLEIHFQRGLGRSIREEIERVRLNWAKQLLVETNLPMQKIADNAGFSSVSYLSKVFRRAAGVTLSQYRRDHRSG